MLVGFQNDYILGPGQAYLNSMKNSFSFLTQPKKFYLSLLISKTNNVSLITKNLLFLLKISTLKTKNFSQTLSLLLLSTAERTEPEPHRSRKSFSESSTASSSLDFANYS